MEIANLAAGSFGATQSQNQAATSALKQSLDSQKDVLRLLQPSPQANLSPGVGGKVDRSV